MRPVASIQKTATGYRARYRDGSKKEHLKRFKYKRDAQRWLDQETGKLQAGTWVAPRDARDHGAAMVPNMAAGLRHEEAITIRQAQVHVDKIVAAFGARRLDSLRPSEIKSWLVELTEEGYADSYIYALHARLAQVLSDAVHDGVLGRSPASRRTAPRTGKPRPYVATTDQIWALHDAMGERYRPGLLLAAFAGLRLAEVCGLQVSDVDFMRGVVSPDVQYPAEELKTEISRTPVPIPRTWRSSCRATWSGTPPTWILCNEAGRQMGPWQLQRAFRAARAQVTGPTGGLPFPRPTALLREPADQLGAGCQGGAGPAAACLSQDHAGHLRAPLARLR